MKNYREGNTSYLYCVPHLIVWQKAMRLVTENYRSTKVFPEDERYGLTSRGESGHARHPSRRFV
ncbi:MAG: four helix bundle protein [Deltaproteobacteria bacterium]|nr:four helix bundle protein [Deltaproteobacteria bacterium]